MILQEIALHIPVTPFFLFAIFALLVLVWGLFTLIIRYHWKSYGVNTLHVLAMNLTYFIGSAILLAAVALFAFLYYGSTAL